MQQMKTEIVLVIAELVAQRLHAEFVDRMKELVKRAQRQMKTEIEDMPIQRMATVGHAASDLETWLRETVSLPGSDAAECAQKMQREGYEGLSYLQDADADELNRLIDKVEMKWGHAAQLKRHLMFAVRLHLSSSLRSRVLAEPVVLTAGGACREEAASSNFAGWCHHGSREADQHRQAETWECPRWHLFKAMRTFVLTICLNA